MALGGKRFGHLCSNKMNEGTTSHVYVPYHRHVCWSRSPLGQTRTFHTLNKSAARCTTCCIDICSASQFSFKSYYMLFLLLQLLAVQHFLREGQLISSIPVQTMQNKKLQGFTDLMSSRCSKKKLS